MEGSEYVGFTSYTHIQTLLDEKLDAQNISRERIEETESRLCRDGTGDDIK